MIIRSVVILILLGGFSERVAVASAPTPPAEGEVYPACAHCYGTLDGDRWEGSWGLQCYDYESPPCRGCPSVLEDCAGGGFYLDYDPCNNPCNDAILELVGN